MEITVHQKNKIFVILTVLRGSGDGFTGPSLRHCAYTLQATQLLSKNYRSGNEPLATLSNLTGLGFQLQLPNQRRARYRSILYIFLYFVHFSALVVYIKLIFRQFLLELNVVELKFV